MNPNNKTVTVKITRRQLCDLILACSWITGDLQISGKNTDKWEALHERLQESLTAHDKHEEEKRW